MRPGRETGPDAGELDLIYRDGKPRSGSFGSCSSSGEDLENEIFSDIGKSNLGQASRPIDAKRWRAVYINCGVIGCFLILIFGVLATMEFVTVEDEDELLQDADCRVIDKVLEEKYNDIPFAAAMCYLEEDKIEDARNCTESCYQCDHLVRGETLVTEAVFINSLSITDITRNGNHDDIVWCEETSNRFKELNRPYSPNRLFVGTKAGKSWTRYQVATSPKVPTCSALATGDFDGDKKMDVAVLSLIDHVLMWYPQPDDISSWRTAEASGIEVSSHVPGAFVEAVDVDLDQDHDLVVGTLDVALAPGSPGFGTAACASDDACKLNGNSIWVYENQDGIGTKWKAHRIARVEAPRHLTATDVDEDGDKDLFFVGGAGHMGWIEHTHKGYKNSAWVVHDIPQTLMKHPSYVVKKDVNGDGLIDIVVASEKEDIVAWYENRNYGGNWTEHVVFRGEPLFRVKGIVVEDFRKDGHMEVIATSFFNSRLVKLSSKDPAGEWKAEVLSECEDGNNVIVTADMDHDGKPEAVYGNMGPKGSIRYIKP